MVLSPSLHSHTSASVIFGADKKKPAKPRRGLPPTTADGGQTLPPVNGIKPQEADKVTTEAVKKPPVRRNPNSAQPPGWFSWAFWNAASFIGPMLIPAPAALGVAVGLTLSLPLITRFIKPEYIDEAGVPISQRKGKIDASKARLSNPVAVIRRSLKARSFGLQFLDKCLFINSKNPPKTGVRAFIRLKARHMANWIVRRMFRFCENPTVKDMFVNTPKTPIQTMMHYGKWTAIGLGVAAYSVLTSKLGACGQLMAKGVLWVLEWRVFSKIRKVAQEIAQDEFTKQAINNHQIVK